VYFPVPNSILGIFNSLYIQNFESFNFSLFSFFLQSSLLSLLVSLDSSIVSTQKSIAFHFSFTPFIKCSLLFPIVSLDFLIVSTQKSFCFLLFSSFYKKFSPIPNSIVGSLNSIPIEQLHFFLLFLFSLMNGSLLFPIVSWDFSILFL